jgi:hypothetical protein
MPDTLTTITVLKGTCQGPGRAGRPNGSEIRINRSGIHKKYLLIMRPLSGIPFYGKFVKTGRIVPSPEEWHGISSIYKARKIFNDGIPPDVYRPYIGRINEAVRRKGRHNRLPANWRMRLKFLFDRPQVT